MSKFWDSLWSRITCKSGDRTTLTVDPEPSPVVKTHFTILLADPTRKIDAKFVTLFGNNVTFLYADDSDHCNQLIRENDIDLLIVYYPINALAFDVEIPNKIKLAQNTGPFKGFTHKTIVLIDSVTGDFQREFLEILCIEKVLPFRTRIEVVKQWADVLLGLSDETPKETLLCF